MTVRTFVDTNVFIYARQADESVKQPIAAEWIERLWRQQTGRTSMQVLSEAYATLTRTVRPTVRAEEAWEYVQPLVAWDPQPLDAQVVEQARVIEQRYMLSWWDSLIVSAAHVQGCSVLLTEDLQDRAVYGSVTACNPFRLGVSEPSAIYGAVAEPAVSQPHRPRGRPRRRSVS
jgi:predicted nucleic acid-binding protein